MLPEAARRLHGPGPRCRRNRSRANRLGARGARSVSRLRGRRAAPFAHSGIVTSAATGRRLWPRRQSFRLGRRNDRQRADSERSRVGASEWAFHPQQHGRPGRRSAWVGMPRHDHQVFEADGGAIAFVLQAGSCQRLPWRPTAVPRGRSAISASNSAISPGQRKATIRRSGSFAGISRHIAVLKPENATPH